MQQVIVHFRGFFPAISAGQRFAFEDERACVFLERLGHIPQAGEHLYYGDLSLEIKEMRRLKIERVQVYKAGEPVEQIEA